jgi:hypothetical protein
MSRQSFNSSDSTQANDLPAKRGLFLRVLYRIYVNYLGVTPPTPEQERTAAVVLIAGVILGLGAVVALVFFLWSAMARMGRT